MEKNNMTAVEWLDRWFRDNPEATHEEGNKALQQAKQMEKKQIMNAFGVGCQVESTRLIAYHGMAEQYYNETYGTTNSNEVTDQHLGKHQEPGS